MYAGCSRPLISCHSIPGIPRADGLVGPPLRGIRERVYIAGVATNTRENIALWILDPRALSPRTAMPAVGATPQEALDMVAYLYAQ